MAKKLEEPAGNASTDEWRAYAAQQDPDQADAIAEMGRDQLRDTYATPAEDEPAASPDNPGQDDASPDTAATPPDAPVVAGPFANVTPPTPTEVADGPQFRVTLHPDRWDVDAVEFPYGDPGESVRIDRAVPLVVSEAEADALIQAAGERGFALTKEKVQ